VSLIRSFEEVIWTRKTSYNSRFFLLATVPGAVAGILHGLLKVHVIRLGYLPNIWQFYDKLAMEPVHFIFLIFFVWWDYMRSYGPFIHPIKPLLTDPERLKDE